MTAPRPLTRPMGVPSVEPLPSGPETLLEKTVAIWNPRAAATIRTASHYGAAFEVVVNDTTPLTITLRLLERPR